MFLELSCGQRCETTLMWRCQEVVRLCRLRGCQCVSNDSRSNIFPDVTRVKSNLHSVNHVCRRVARACKHTGQRHPPNEARTANKGIVVKCKILGLLHLREAGRLLCACVRVRIRDRGTLRVDRGNAPLSHRTHRRTCGGGLEPIRQRISSTFGGRGVYKVGHSLGAVKERRRAATWGIQRGWTSQGG